MKLAQQARPLRWPLQGMLLVGFLLAAIPGRAQPATFQWAAKGTGPAWNGVSTTVDPEGNQILLTPIYNSGQASLIKLSAAGVVLWSNYRLHGG